VLLCPACGERLELSGPELRGMRVVRCPSCLRECPAGELLIPSNHRELDDDDTEQDHEGPYFWNRGS